VAAEAECPRAAEELLILSGALVDFEMENIRDLKVRTIDQDQIATDHNVRVIRRRRREHHFEFPRAGLHFLLKARRQSSANLFLAKTLSGCEINSLQDFLTALTCHNSCPRSAGSGFGSDCSCASFVPIETCS
jgi:hypothetical protein